MTEKKWYVPDSEWNEKQRREHPAYTQTSDVIRELTAHAAILLQRLEKEFEVIVVHNTTKETYYEVDCDCCQNCFYRSDCPIFDSCFQCNGFVDIRRRKCKLHKRYNTPCIRPSAYPNTEPRKPYKK